MHLYNVAMVNTTHSSIITSATVEGRNKNLDMLSLANAFYDYLSPTGMQEGQNDPEATGLWDDAFEILGLSPRDEAEHVVCSDYVSDLMDELPVFLAQEWARYRSGK